MRSRLKLLQPGEALPLRPRGKNSPLRHLSALQYSPEAACISSHPDLQHEQLLHERQYPNRIPRSFFSRVEFANKWPALVEHDADDQGVEASGKDRREAKAVGIDQVAVNVKGKERASEEEIASWSLADDKADLLALGYNVDLDRIELRTLAMELETRTAQWNCNTTEEHSSLSSTSSASSSRGLQSSDVLFRLLSWTLDHEGPAVYVAKKGQARSSPTSTLYSRLVSWQILQLARLPASAWKKGGGLDSCNDALCAEIISDDVFDQALRLADSAGRFDLLGLLLEKATRRGAPRTCHELLQRFFHLRHDLIDSDPNRLLPLLQQSFINADQCRGLPKELCTRIRHLILNLPSSPHPTQPDHGTEAAAARAEEFSIAMLRAALHSHSPLVRRPEAVAPQSNARRNASREQRRLRSTIMRLYRLASSATPPRGTVSAEWVARAIRALSSRAVPSESLVDLEAHGIEPSIKSEGSGKDPREGTVLENTVSVAAANVAFVRRIYEREIVKRLRLGQSSRSLPIASVRLPSQEEHRGTVREIRGKEAWWTIRAMHAMLDVELKVASSLLQQYSSLAASASTSRRPRIRAETQSIIQSQLQRVTRIVRLLTQVEVELRSRSEGSEEDDDRSLREEEWAKARVDMVTTRLLLIRGEHRRAVSYLERVVSSASQPRLSTASTAMAAEQRLTRGCLRTRRMQRFTMIHLVQSLCSLLLANGPKLSVVSIAEFDRALHLINRSVFDVDIERNCWIRREAKEELALMYWRLLSQSSSAYRAQKSLSRASVTQKAAFWTTMMRLRETLIGLASSDSYGNGLFVIRTHFWDRRVDFIDKALDIAGEQQEEREEEMAILTDILCSVEKREKGDDEAAIRERAMDRLDKVAYRRAKVERKMAST
ncbi:hypothetical protein FA10DRAFT_269085 [Acaromyces ingoldii]|uniref:Uncharacterized protein n=1 Tax=Acaromyces ingoldii TaxID=215250 RepID=A0A316YI59_9BASI|nr:hypothetical protein FA10DRAFT_269085 [Acaromyces ingoldii]PWN87803.1 hypothetical protein FA10DRAFT_269085 [Acaromyces ingoldii]